MNNNTVEQSAIIHLLTASKQSAPLWFVVRMYLGYEWLMAGYEKIINPAWFGSGAGAALNGFVQGALAKTTGAHPDVQMWYAAFLKGTVLPHLVTWSNLVAVGEVLVGVGLIVGLFTGAAAFFGFFMNINFMLAGTVSINPILMMLALSLILARRVAGYWGLDHYVRPFLKHRFSSKRFR